MSKLPEPLTASCFDTCILTDTNTKTQKEHRRAKKDIHLMGFGSLTPMLVATTNTKQKHFDIKQNKTKIVSIQKETQSSVSDPVVTSLKPVGFNYNK